MVTIRDLMYASKLKTLREQKNIKQFYAASIIGVECQQHYSDYESGKKHFSEEIIRKICDGFKIQITEFKKISFDILDQLIQRADMDNELQTFVKKHSKKEQQLYLLECEKRLIEMRLENARKNKEILELQINRYWAPKGEVPKIYVMA